MENNNQNKNSLWTIYIVALIIMALMIEGTVLGLLAYAYIKDKPIDLFVSLMFTPLLALSRFFPSAKNKKDKIIRINENIIEEEEEE